MSPIFDNKGMMFEFWQHLRDWQADFFKEVERLGFSRVSKPETQPWRAYLQRDWEVPKIGQRFLDFLRLLRSEDIASLRRGLKEVQSELAIIEERKKIHERMVIPDSPETGAQALKSILPWLFAEGNFSEMLKDFLNPKVCGSGWRFYVMAKKTKGITIIRCTRDKKKWAEIVIVTKASDLSVAWRYEFNVFNGGVLEVYIKLTGRFIPSIFEGDPPIIWPKQYKGKNLRVYASDRNDCVKEAFGRETSKQVLRKLEIFVKYLYEKAPSKAKHQSPLLTLPKARSPRMRLI